MPHNLFKRKGADLHIEKEITLMEALTGIDFTIEHLDGRMVRIMNKAGSVIKPNMVMTAEGLGMPFHKQSFKFGNLFIHFKVKFPDTLKKETMEEIAMALGGGSSPEEVNMEVEEVCELVDVKEEHKNLHHEGGATGQGDDEEEEEDMGGRQGGVRC
mmetsp:Transcript_22421/g.16913  ORF Transcript_22421/g.16913 Transcript_22421/m.16913 type:complete len:157 (+) Transcript_22421:801-1271(+)